MLEENKLSDDEKRIITELTDKLITVSDRTKIDRAELFNRLSMFVAGIKLGLASNVSEAV